MQAVNWTWVILNIPLHCNTLEKCQTLDENLIDCHHKDDADDDVDDVDDDDDDHHHVGDNDDEL